MLAAATATRSFRRPVAPKPIAGLSPARELARRRVVQLVFLIYLLAIFEGSLRKWALPQFSQYIFFIRDPFLLLAYALATTHGLWPRANPLFTISLAMAVGGLLLAVVQASVGGTSDLRLILAAYGWRSYFLYVPLAFLVGQVFSANDLMRAYRMTLLLAVPIAALVTLQFFSAQDAPINVGSAAEEELQFRGLGLNVERTRPMGTFSSGNGQQMFVATACVIVLGLFVSPPRPGRPALPALLIAAAAVMTCIGLSGSRGTVLQCALAAAFAMAYGLIGRGGGTRARAVIWPLMLGAAGLVLYPIVFPEGFAAFSQRWVTADALESRAFESGVFGRALFGLVEFVRLIDVVPTLGYGLGYGGNASVLLGASIDGVKIGFLAETDFARHMVDLGPVFGGCYIVFRVALAAALAAQVIRVTRQVPDPMPMLLLSFVAYIIVMGTLTGQGAVNLYGWLFAGFLMAACQHAGAAQHRRIATPSRRMPRSAKP